MSKRITIMLEDNIVKKLRLKQAKKISQENTSYSLSRVINETLTEALKK